MSDTYLFNSSCSSCGTSNGKGLFERPDGTIYAFCYKQNKFCDEDADSKSSMKQSPSITKTKIEDLPTVTIPSRALSQWSLKKYGIKVEMSETNGQPFKVFFPYYKDGKLVGWKGRELENKDSFFISGNIRGCELFGQSTVPQGGKLLIIVEGEFDVPAAHELLKRKNKDYNVVSVINGAQSAKKSVQTNLEFVESFESVIIAFDNDEPGREAAKDVAELLSPGKAKIATLPLKDANDLLKANREDDFLKAIYNAREHRPDGIVRLSQTWDELWRQENTVSVPYPWTGLNQKVYGVRPGEIVVIGSGSGLGKSSIMRELQHWLFKNTNDNIGILALEENIGRTDWGILSVEASIPLHIREERQERGVTQDQVKDWWNKTIGTGRFVAYDHFGSMSEANLIQKIRYMVKAMDCKWIFLDHISIVVSDSGEIGENERIAIDTIMTRLRSLVEETMIGMFVVTHLKRPPGKGHEKGAEVELAHFRGSGSIAHLADISLAGERNQQEEEEKKQNLTKIRVLKNRYAGHTGVATHLYYDRQTGRLKEIVDVEAFLSEGEELDEV